MKGGDAAASASSSASSSTASATALAVPIPYAPAAAQQEQAHGAQDGPAAVLRRRLPFALSVKQQKARRYICVCVFFTMFVTFFLLTILIASLQYTEQLKFSFSGQSKNKKGYNNVWWEKLLSPNSTAAGGAGSPLPSSPSLSPSQPQQILPSGHCNNTLQGSKWITDSRGVVCLRKDVLATGCCGTEDQNARYVCKGCMDNSGSECCELYEVCVSCCMTPSRLDALNRHIEGIVGPGKATVVDEGNSFFVCSALCRTSSKSIVRQRFYKSVTHKYCYN